MDGLSRRRSAALRGERRRRPVRIRGETAGRGQRQRSTFAGARRDPGPNRQRHLHASFCGAALAVGRRQMSALALTVLGATGSVGKSTLDVAGRHPERYRILALTAHSGAQALLELCLRHKPRYAVLSGTSPDEALKRRFALGGTELLFGAAALERVATDGGCRLVMAAIVGAAGLPATL